MKARVPVSVDDYEYHLYEEVRAGRMTRLQFMRRAAIAGVSSSAVGAILAACGGTSGSATKTSGTQTAAAGTPKRGGTATIALPPPTAEVDPVLMDNIGANLTVPIAAEYLVFPDPNYILRPVLAVSWKAIKADVWEFKLRPNVKFQDGTLMTAADVKATMDRLADPKVNSPALTNFQGVLSKGGTEVVDDHTVRFNLDSPYADFPVTLSAFNYNTVILPKNYKVGDFAKGGVGTGPYILKSQVPKQSASFVRNPSYWAPGLPYLDAVKVQYFADTASAVTALQAGQADLYPNTPYQGSQALYANSSITVLQDPSSEYRAVHMRVDRPPFNDVRVRQALALSIDRPALIQTLFNGRGTVGNDHGFAPVFPVSAEVIQQVPQRTQDIAKAKSLLAAAGHGSGISATLTIEDYLEEPDYGIALAQQAKAAGFNITPHPEPQATYYGSPSSGQPWLTVPFGLTGWGERGSPVQLITPAYTAKGVWNSAHWKNAEFTNLIKQLAGELDEQKAKQLAVQAAKVQNDQVPVLISYWIKQQRAIRTNVHGIAPGPVSHLDVSRMWLS
jgi:peptide/nickel transport system substrate-binding protein